MSDRTCKQRRIPWSTRIDFRRRAISFRSRSIRFPSVALSPSSSSTGSRPRKATCIASPIGAFGWASAPGCPTMTSVLGPFSIQACILTDGLGHFPLGKRLRLKVPLRVAADSPAFAARSRFIRSPAVDLQLNPGTERPILPASAAWDAWPFPLKNQWQLDIADL